LIPNAEEAKAIQEKSKRDRYNQNDDKLIDEEKIDSVELKSTGLFRSRAALPKKDPVGLDNNMLVGQQAKQKKRERHISNLSISEVGSEQNKDSVRGSLFR
jgi:hypothetical protein